MTDPDRSAWYAVRKKHGADSIAGRLASKLIRLSLTRDKPERAAFCDGAVHTVVTPDAAATAPAQLDEEIYLGLQEAKMLIGGKNDSLSEAVKAANINKAWHILDRILNASNVTPAQPTRDMVDKMLAK